MEGAKLLDQLVALTGLPEPMIRQELGQILEFSGQKPEALTLDELRSAMLAYLESTHATLAE